MKTKFRSLLIGASLIVLSCAANAAPLALSDTQMDRVSAGAGTSFGEAFSTVLSNLDNVIVTRGVSEADAVNRVYDSLYTSSAIGISTGVVSFAVSHASASSACVGAC